MTCMKSLPWLKIPLACLLVALAVASLIVPVKAVLTDGEVYNISSLGAGSPDIEISSDGAFIAVAYYKQGSGQEGPVYVKSANNAGGWVTSTFVGTGSDPHLAFQSGVNNVVYVVWRKAGGTSISSAKCTLASATAPNCTAGADVRTVSTDQLNFPDVAVTNGGIVHVVWQNSTGPGVTKIETARSTAAANVSAWNAPVTVAGSGVNRKPVLAFGNSLLHLAFLKGSSTSILTQIQYHQSSNGSSWSNPANYSISGGAGNISTVHDTLDNPTIAVSGSNVYLAWDAHLSGGNNFTLIYANSTSSGSSNWSGPFYFDTNDAASSNPNTINPEINVRASFNISQPPQQVGLRPSLTINGTTPAIVWHQQKPPIDCFSLGVGTLYVYRGSPLINAGSDFLENSDDNDLMIDPDIAIQGGNIHQVYMLHARAASAPVPSCPPGVGAGSYLISYRGPFINKGNDAGEGGNSVFLPLIRKNS